MFALLATLEFIEYAIFLGNYRLAIWSMFNSRAKSTARAKHTS
jgi:hypothetical protein